MAMETATNSVISMFFFFFLVSTPLFFSPTDAASDIVEGVCKESGNYSFCIKALELDPRTAGAKNHMDLAVIALEMGISNSTGTRIYIARMYRSPKTDPPQQSALKGCLWGYDGAVSSFKSALMELRVDPLTANYDAKLAGDGATYCSGVMESAGMNDSSISDGNRFTLSLSDIAFVITNYLD